MSGETKLFVFLLLDKFHKCMEAYIEKKGAKVVPLKDTLAKKDSREVN